MKLFLLILPALVLAAPEGPKTGPPGTKLVYDLLQNQYGGQLGAFNTVYWQPGHVNEEQQWYVPENAVQDASGQITIKAERRSDGQVYSARLESYGLWTTASSPATKNRGYVEVKALIPAKVGGGNLKGAWPAIWMLGAGNGAGWPTKGEIDIVEVANGNPNVIMSAHSTNHHGGGPQHPGKNPIYMASDFTTTPLVCGMEWNIRDNIGQIDLTWWMSWNENGAWKEDHTTLSLFKNGNNDYYDFFNSFNGEGFSLLINLAEGGVFPGGPDCLVDGQPQYVVVQEAKVYGF